MTTVIFTHDAVPLGTASFLFVETRKPPV